MAGGALVAVTTLTLAEGGHPARQLASLVAYATLMLGMCLTTCVVPTRRALGVQPTEALRVDQARRRVSRRLSAPRAGRAGTRSRS